MVSLPWLGAKMGHVRVTVEITNPLRPERSLIVPNALVDTGASRTTIPRALAEELQLEILGTSQVRTADGTSVLDQSFALITLNDRRSVGDIWVRDTYSGVLIGVITLESLGLAVDPKSGQLFDSPFLLL